MVASLLVAHGDASRQILQATKVGPELGHVALGERWTAGTFVAAASSTF